MESELFRKMQRRIVKNFLEMLILMRLKERALSGYDVTRFIHRKFHILLSTGTVYSHLYHLERDNLVEGRWDSRKRVYGLTEKGEETVESFLKLKEKMLGLIVNLFI